MPPRRTLDPDRLTSEIEISPTFQPPAHPGPAVTIRPRRQGGGRPALPVGAHGDIRYYRTRTGWRAMTTYRDIDGVTRRVERHGKTQGKARNRLLAGLNTRRHTGDTGHAEITTETKLKDLADYWYAVKEAEGKAYRTLESYRSRIDNQIKPGVGNLRVREATVQLLDRFVARVKDKHGSTSAKVTRTCLSGMLGLAARYGAIDHNPVRDVATITIDHAPTRALTLDEARDLRARIHADSRAEARDLIDFTDMMQATGERISETAAVGWDALDLDEEILTGTVEIRGIVIRKKGQGLCIQAKPKTEAGYRSHELPTWMVASLLRRKTERDPAPTDPVFPNIETGQGLRDPSNTQDHLRDAFDDAGYTWVTSHIYRKTVATLMDQAGLTARQAADQLGHADISVTQKHYFGRNKIARDAAKVLEAIDNRDTDTTPGSGDTAAQTDETTSEVVADDGTAA